MEEIGSQPAAAVLLDSHERSGRRGESRCAVSLNHTVYLHGEMTETAFVVGIVVSEQPLGRLYRDMSVEKLVIYLLPFPAAPP